MDIDKKTLTYGAIILITLALAFFVLPVQIKHTLGVNKQIKLLHETINKSQEEIALRQKITQDTEQIKLAIAQLQSKIIGVEDISSVQTYISQAAKENNLEVIETSSSPPTVYKKIGATSFVQIPINISAKGNFHNLGNFLAKIESGEYCLEVRRLKINYAKPQLGVSLIIAAVVHG